MRRLAAVAVGLLLLLPTSEARGAEDPAVPETAILEQLPTSRKCVPDADNTYEQQQYDLEGWGPTRERYPGDCERLRFVFGPIHTKPGQNDVLIEPVTIQKPAYDGYVVRFEPNLVRADGTVPGVHQIHLHHAVWLNLGNNYGNSGFFATGEEKTILTLPKGFGMPVEDTDTWQLLYMIHNQFPNPEELFITYEVDYIPKAVAERPVAEGGLGLKRVYPVWLDVRPSPYPVFNAQRGFGTDGKCTWPTENCAAFDPWGNTSWKQGCANCAAPGPGDDNVVELPGPGGSLGRIRNFQGGALVHIAGHLHPGGVTVQVDHLRSGQTPTRIFTSDGVYWVRTVETSRTGPPTSWDVSMTAAYIPKWVVRVEPGDDLSITATYDTAIQSTYENMGIAVAWLAPGSATGDPRVDGINPFVAPVDDAGGCPSGGLLAATPTLCTRGEVTHGHLEEAEVYGAPSEATELEAATGAETRVISISDFKYFPGGFGTVESTGIPSVRQGNGVTFVNMDAAANIWHSITSCAYPCEGNTGIAFPLSDGTSSEDDSVDFDSGQLGFWVPTLGPAKNRADWELTIDGSFTPGTYTFFCRVHPFMRGALEVLP